MELFPFVGPEHPFYSDIERLRTEVSAHPLCRDATHRTSSTEVRALMRARQVPGGGWGLKWVSVSFQSRDARRPSRFDALTLVYSAKTQRIEAYEFPHDPCLPTATSFFVDAASGQDVRRQDLDVDVCRYIPRRRLTFLVRHPFQGGAPVVGKFVRTAELEAAYETLGEVHRAVARAPSMFQWPLPGASTGRRASSSRRHGPRNLSWLVSRRTRRPIRSEPSAPFIGDADVQWIAFFCPEQASFLEGD